jgi:hypothetical protein
MGVRQVLFWSWRLEALGALSETAECCLAVGKLLDGLSIGKLVPDRDEPEHGPVSRYGDKKPSVANGVPSRHLRAAPDRGIRLGVVRGINDKCFHGCFHLAGRPASFRTYCA